MKHIINIIFVLVFISSTNKEDQRILDIYSSIKDCKTHITDFKEYINKGRLACLKLNSN